MPSGTFTRAGVKTVVLFFGKGEPTKKIWYYQLDPKRSLGKTNPLNDNDMAEFIALQKGFEDSPNSWSVDIADIDETSFDLSVKNPNESDEVILRNPQEILEEMERLDKQTNKLLRKIKGLI